MVNQDTAENQGSQVHLHRASLVIAEVECRVSLATAVQASADFLVVE